MLQILDICFTCLRTSFSIRLSPYTSEYESRKQRHKMRIIMFMKEVIKFSAISICPLSHLKTVKGPFMSATFLKNKLDENVTLN